MDFKDLQDQIFQNALRYGEKYNVVIDEDFALLKLYEEAGELAQAVLIHRKKSRPEKYVSAEESKQRVSEELADVIGLAIVLAKLLDINLEEVFRVKWINQK